MRSLKGLAKAKSHHHIYLQKHPQCAFSKITFAKPRKIVARHVRPVATGASSLQDSWADGHRGLRLFSQAGSAQAPAQGHSQQAAQAAHQNRHRCAQSLGQCADREETQG
jgi:hypothetical protein